MYDISIQPVLHAVLFSAIFKKKSLPEILWVFMGKISYALELLSSLFLKKSRFIILSLKGFSFSSSQGEVEEQKTNTKMSQ